MLFQLNPSSSMIINRARLTSAAGETRDRVNDTNARRSSLVRLKTDCMLHIVLLKSMLHNTSAGKFSLVPLHDTTVELLSRIQRGDDPSIPRLSVVSSIRILASSLSLLKGISY